MASSVNPLTSSTAPASGSTSGSNSASSAAALANSTPTEGMFLQLLVAQLQNQDPLNPTDSTTFVTQLAQFSELEQVIGIRSDIESEMASTSSTSQSSTPTTPSTTPASQTNSPTQS